MRMQEAVILVIVSSLHVENTSLPATQSSTIYALKDLYPHRITKYRTMY
jgi:hypothetical protein